MPDGPRYDEDFYAWTQYQSEVLRTMRTRDNRFDREHVAEEVEDLGKSERDAVRSQIRRVLEHLLKLRYSAAVDPRPEWIDSVIDARDQLADKLSPTLRRDAEAEIDALYARARRRAANGLRKYGEAGAAEALPEQCPYTLHDVLRDDWYPEPNDQTGGDR